MEAPTQPFPSPPQPAVPHPGATPPPPTLKPIRTPTHTPRVLKTEVLPELVATFTDFRRSQSNRSLPWREVIIGMWPVTQPCQCVCAPLPHTHSQTHAFISRSLVAPRGSNVITDFLFRSSFCCDSGGVVGVCHQSLFVWLVGACFFCGRARVCVQQCADQAQGGPHTSSTNQISVSNFPVSRGHDSQFLIAPLSSPTIRVRGAHV